MQQVRDTLAIIFFIIWICVGIATLLFLYNNYDLSQSAKPGIGGPGQMQQYPGGSGTGYGQGQGTGLQGTIGTQGQGNTSGQSAPPSDIKTP